MQISSFFTQSLLFKIGRQRSGDVIFQVGNPCETPNQHIFNVYGWCWMHRAETTKDQSRYIPAAPSELPTSLPTGNKVFVGLFVSKCQKKQGELQPRIKELLFDQICGLLSHVQFGSTLLRIFRIKYVLAIMLFIKGRLFLTELHWNHNNS